MGIDRVDGGWDFDGWVDDEAGLMMVVVWVDDRGWVLIVDGGWVENILLNKCVE